MKLIIHIGARKCGSTSIQKWLSEADFAAPNLPFFYCESGRGSPQSGDGHFAHHVLTSLSAKSRLAWCDVLTELASKSIATGIISSEVFHGLAPRALSEIDGLMASSGVRATVILLVRDPLKLLISEYAQQIKFSGEARGFHEFAMANLELVQFDAQIARWGALSSVDQVIAGDLDEIQKEGMDAVGAFCRLAEIPLTPHTLAHANTTPPSRALTAMRNLNRLSLTMFGRDIRLARMIRNSIKRNRFVGRTAVHLLGYGQTVAPAEEVQRVAATLKKSLA